MGVKARRVWRGSTMFVLDDLLPMAEMDSRGFRRLRPGAEGVLKLLLNGTRRDGTANASALASKRVRELMASDPDGVAAAAALYGPARRALLRGAARVVRGGWDRRAMLTVQAWAVLRGLIEPRVLADRLYFRLGGSRRCPIAHAILAGGRRIPGDLDEWLQLVRREHIVHEPAADATSIAARSRSAHILDISLPLAPDMPVSHRNPRFEVRPVMRRTAGDATDVSELRLGSHSGTHVDAPAHLLDHGASAEALELNALLGDAFVVDLRSVAGHIDGEALDRCDVPPRVERLLIRTRNSDARPAIPDEWWQDYIGLSSDGAGWVANRNLLLVGIDGPSIEPFDTPGRPTHRLLLEAGVVILEGLDLAAVQPGRYRLACLPLRLVGLDGAPARAVLIRD
jgi:arylformamidase